MNKPAPTGWPPGLLQDDDRGLSQWFASRPDARRMVRLVAQQIEENGMKAFHNDPAVKAKYQQRLAAHRAAENLIQGTGFADGKGCAVGCTLENYDHALYPIELGLPEWLARLEDRIFEGLPKGEAEQFAEDFLAAIPVGADVDGVRGKLAVLRLTRQLPALDANPEPYAKQCADALRLVIDWHHKGEPESAAESARSAAWSAESAARSAAESAESAAWSAESAAESAAWSAESAARSAESAAESAAWSAESAESESAESESARSAAEFNHYRWEAATLLQLLKDSK